MAVTVNDGGLVWTASIDTSQLQKGVAEINERLNSVTKTTNQQATAIDNFTTKAIAAISAYATFAVGKDFIGDIIRVRGEFQQLEVAFETMLGSKAKADQLLAEVTEFAATTPFELKDVAKATKLLLAFGISAEDIKGDLRALGDVSAGLNQPIGEIAFLFGQIKTQGRAMTIDVRQFAQRGIPIYEELAKVLKVNVDQVDELITAGKVGFPEIEAVFKSLTAEGSRFGGLMEKQSHTLLGQISNLRDAFDEMLNEIGRSGEGIFADAISGVKFLVDNYKTIIDILKVLIITYGSYRAAVIATNVVTQIATALNEGLTLKLFLQAKAAKFAEVANKLLNKTLLANPYAAAAAAIVALIGTLVLFGRSASLAKSKSELLAEAQKQIGSNLAEIQGKILPYVEALKKANISEQERIDIYNKLRAIDPKIVEGLNAKTLSYASLTGNVNLYIEALKKQFALEVNKKATDLAVANLNELGDKLEAVRKKIGQNSIEIDAIKAAGKPDRRLPGLVALQEQEIKQAERLNADIFAQENTLDELVKKTIEGEGKKQGAVKRTEDVIKAEIETLKKRQSAESAVNKEHVDFDRQIKVLEAELKKITGETNKDIKDRIALENALLAILDKRKSVLEAIADVEREAVQSGLSKEASEIDKINEKRDKQLELIKKTNQEIERFNKLNKQKVPLISKEEIERLNKAADTLIRNFNFKKDADVFIDNLKLKEQAFKDFQAAQLTGNQELINQSKAANAEQLQDFTAFVDLLKFEYNKLITTILSKGFTNVGELKKLEALKELLDKATREADEETKKRNKQNLEDLLKQTTDFNKRRQDINDKFNRLQETNEKNEGGVSPKVLEERRKAIEKAREKEILDLDNALIRESALYEKLSLDIIGFSKKQIKEQIKDLDRILKKSGELLSVQQKADIKSRREQLKGILDSTNDVSGKFAQLSADLSDIGGAFGELSESVRDLNGDLADTLKAISDVVNIASKAASSVASFASGDIVGGVTSAVSTIASIIGVFAKNKKSADEAKQAIIDFQFQVEKGELDHQAMIRERQRVEAKAHKEKLKGLEDEKKVLEEQRVLVIKTQQELLAKLQQESFISSQQAKKKHGGLFSFLSGTEVVDQLTSLAGKSFDEIEKLFEQGQLTDKAKELFEELKKAKDEGLDIDRLLEENKIQAQQLLTGTTADTITDTIIQGLEGGKRAVKDFAGDFQKFMQDAILNSLKFKFLEGPISKLFEDFAAATESQGQLTTAEIDRLKVQYDTIITNAVSQFEQLQKIAGLNFSTDQAGQKNTLTGAIKGITESQADLLAGQFGGLRITAIDQLREARRGIEVLQNIEGNTAKLISMEAIFNRIEKQGLKVI